MRIVCLLIGMVVVCQGGCSSQPKGEQRQENAARRASTAKALALGQAVECGEVDGKTVWRYEHPAPRATILSTSTNFPDEVAKIPAPVRDKEVDPGDPAIIRITDGWIYVIGAHVPVGADTTVAVADGSKFIIDATVSTAQPRVLHRGGTKPARTWVENDPASQETINVHRERLRRGGAFSTEIQSRIVDEDGLLLQVCAAAELCGGVDPP